MKTQSPSIADMIVLRQIDLTQKHGFHTSPQKKQEKLAFHRLQAHLQPPWQV